MKRLLTLFLSVLLCLNLIMPSFVSAEYEDGFEETCWDSPGYEEDWLDVTADGEWPAEDSWYEDTWFEESWYEEDTGYEDDFFYSDGSEEFFEYDPEEEFTDWAEDSGDEWSDGILWEEEAPASEAAETDEDDFSDEFLPEIEANELVTANEFLEETCTVTLQDCLGSEVRKDHAGEAGNALDYTFTVPKGTSLIDFWAAAEEPVSLVDVPARKLSDITWNTADGVGFDLTTPIEEDLVLSSQYFVLKLHDLPQDFDAEAAASNEEGSEEPDSDAENAPEADDPKCIKIGLRVGDKIRDVLNQTYEVEGILYDRYVSAYDGKTLGKCVWFEENGAQTGSWFEDPLDESFAITDVYAHEVILTALAPDDVELGSWSVRYGANLTPALAAQEVLDVLSSGWSIVDTEAVYTLDETTSLNGDTVITPQDPEKTALYRIFLDDEVAGYVLPGQPIPDFYRSCMTGPYLVGSEEVEDIQEWLAARQFLLTGDLYLYGMQDVGLFVEGDPAATHTVTFKFERSNSNHEIRGSVAVAVAHGKKLTKEQLKDSTYLDYRMFKWVKNDGATVDLSDLEVTEDLTLIGTPIGENNNYGRTIAHCYVLLNGAWAEVGTINTRGLTDIFGGSRLFVTASDLETVFGPFGFTEDGYEGEVLFPHEAIGADKTNLWFTQPLELNGLWLVRTVTTVSNCNVYYVPDGGTAATNCPQSDYLSGDKLANNGFYSVTWNDLETGTTGKTYVRHGGSVTVDLPGTGKWSYVDADGNEVTCTGSVTLTNVTKAYTISTAYDGFRVKYDIGTPTGMNKSDMPTITLDGQAMPQSFSVEFDSADNRVKAPDRESYLYTKNDTQGNPVSSYFDFKGWKLTKGSESIYLQPGDTITREIYGKYANANKELELQGIWTNKDSYNNFINVNYYVCVDGDIKDTVGDIDGRPKNRFTGCVYTTRIQGVEGLQLTLPGSNESVLGSSTNTAAYDVNEKIRQLDTVPVLWTYKKDAQSEAKSTFISLQSTPDDELIIGKLREWQTVHYNDREDDPQNESKAIRIKQVDDTYKKVEINDLTTQNYTVRWYVLKLDGSDSWHIDGIIVPKSGKLRVEKTFSGDEAAIEKAKETFAVRLQTTGATDIVINTTTEGVEVSEDQKSYTWVVDTYPYATYSVKEEGYEISKLNGTAIDTTAKVAVHEGGNKVIDEQDVPAAGVPVTSKTYADDAPKGAYQTIEFTNTYLPRGTLMIQKIDQVSRGPIAGVSFAIGRASEDEAKSVDVYKNPNNSSGGTYSAKMTNPYTEKVNDVVTDANGEITILGLDEGKMFTLTENTPEGYATIGRIIISTSRNESTNAIEFNLDTSNVLEDSKDKITLTNAVLQIQNVPKKANLTVNKTWSGINSDQYPDGVKVQLYRRIVTDANGAGTAQNYTANFPWTPTTKYVTLDKDNKWSATIDNLPLYENGQKLEYSLRETRIGNESSGVLWSAAYDDGFNSWEVEVSDPVYKSGSTLLDGSKDSKSGDYANSIEYTVTNTSYINEFTLHKVDEFGQPVPGAVFRINGNEGTVNFKLTDTGAYEYVTSTHASDTGVTTRLQAGSDGNIVIRGLNLAEGYQFELQEKSVPIGYDQNMVWPVEITLAKKGIGTVTVKGDAGNATAEHDAFASKTADGGLQIVNRSLPEIEIEKHLLNTQNDTTDFNFVITTDTASSIKQDTSYPYYLTDAAGNVTNGTLDAKTEGQLTFTLKQDQKIRIIGLPATGYTVEEVNIPYPYFFDSQTTKLTVGTNVQASSVSADIKASKTLIGGQVWNVSYMNGLNPPVPTGIFTDSMPYILMMLVAFAGAILTFGGMLLRSRRREGDGIG